MNDAQLRDLMTSAYDAVPSAPSPLDPDADLGRGRTARGRRRARRAGAGAVLAVAALAAGAALIQPGAGAARVPATPGPTPVVSTTGVEGSVSSSELEQRMEQALREHLVDADQYLGKTALPAGGGDAVGANVGIRRPWVKNPEDAFGAPAVYLVSRASLPDGVTWPVDERWMCSTLVGPDGSCSVVFRRDDIGVFTAQDEGLPRAYALYADGRSVEARLEPADPPTEAVGAPLPTLDELAAVVSDPALAWPGSLEAREPDRPSVATIPSTGKSETVTPTDYGRRMENAIRTHLSGASTYLGAWEPPTGGLFVEAANPDGPVDAFGVWLGWSEGDEEQVGTVRIVSSRQWAGDESGRPYEEAVCGFAAGRYGGCSLVLEKDGIQVFYGEDGYERQASALYPDGREVKVRVTDWESSAGTQPTDVPVPTRAEIIALVTDPTIAWPGEVAGPHPFVPERSILEQHQIEMDQWENMTGNG